MSKNIEQIYYGSWSDKLNPEHNDYWAHIGYISDFIALMLEGYRSTVISDPNNPDKTICVPNKYNTIVVSSNKEKFGQVRVYWYAADPILVEQQYEKLHKNEKCSLEQFRERCYNQDLLHYRSVYFIMKQCFPQYWEAISCGADNHELLYESKEEYLKDMEEEINKEISRNGGIHRKTFLEEHKDFVFKLLKWE